MRNVILAGDVRERLRDLPDESVHCVITSPPYWTLRDYGVPGQLGLEKTRDEYVANLVEVFREVRRVLRKDGSLWLNIGDAYIGVGHGPIGKTTSISETYQSAASPGRGPQRGGHLKNKDLSGCAWAVALALQADGWWLRRDIVWFKPNPTPESARDRPTSAHEFVFLLTRSARYFYDKDAVSETKSSIARISQKTFARQTGGPKDYGTTGVSNHRSARRALEQFRNSGGGRRNLRDVWEIAPEPSGVKHYASYPRKLVALCLKAATSEAGCCEACGAPWVRQVEINDPNDRLGKSYHDHKDDLVRGQRGIPSELGRPARRTVGWKPTCEHEAPRSRPVVLDPFIGSGTTALVAQALGRDYIGIELNDDYVRMAEDRLQKERRLL